MRRGRRNGGEAHANHDRWLVSYADFVTLLFAFFTTMYAISTVDRAKAANLQKSMTGALRLAPADPVPPPRTGAPFVVPTVVVLPDPPPSEPPPLARLIRELSATAASPGLRGRMQVLPDSSGVTLSLAEASFFAPGHAEVRADALDALDIVADKLHDYDRDEPLAVTVAGHTDDRPLHGGRFHSNLELSAGRATFVAARLIQQHQMAAARISAAGYGEWRPVAENTDPQGRARNRRVDIRVELEPSRH